MLFRFAVFCLFMSIRVWGCGDGGPCPDGDKCHSPDAGENCPDDAYECCFDHSTDEESHTRIIVLCVTAGLVVVGIVGSCVYRKKQEESKGESKGYFI